ncbi:basic proline-rich protein-like [Cavia porcellus]|uniref:basic proline-rich protein-like n=1 Tax=Cavia porcellus TaxID=10141 RepID=UPI002FE12D95
MGSGRPRKGTQGSSGCIPAAPSPSLSVVASPQPQRSPQCGTCRAEPAGAESGEEGRGGASVPGLVWAAEPPGAGVEEETRGAGAAGAADLGPLRQGARVAQPSAGCDPLRTPDPGTPTPDLGTPTPRTPDPRTTIPRTPGSLSCASGNLHPAHPKPEHPGPLDPNPGSPTTRTPDIRTLIPGTPPALPGPPTQGPRQLAPRPKTPTRDLPSRPPLSPPPVGGWGVGRGEGPALPLAGSFVSAAKLLARHQVRPDPARSRSPRQQVRAPQPRARAPAPAPRLARLGICLNLGKLVQVQVLL